MKAHFPSADEYSAEKARYPGLSVVDVRAHLAAIHESYRNDVLSNVNDNCLRLAVFDGEYRWHQHPDSDELFLVVEGKLLVDLAGHDTLELDAWQCAVVPAGTVHRTRTSGRTVNLAFEKQQAKTVFLDARDH
jgi:mannose-6-phosphate isomerase-like protein (cupin superfamily)